MGAHIRLVRLAAVLCLIAGVVGCDRTTAQQHFDRGQSFVAANDPRSAIIEFKNALQKDPNLAVARFALGQTELTIGDYPSAVKELERALDLGADRAAVMAPFSKRDSRSAATRTCSAHCPTSRRLRAST